MWSTAELLRAPLLCFWNSHLIANKKPLRAVWAPKCSEAFGLLKQAWRGLASCRGLYNCTLSFFRNINAFCKHLETLSPKEWGFGGQWGGSCVLRSFCRQETAASPTWRGAFHATWISILTREMHGRLAFIRWIGTHVVHCRCLFLISPSLGYLGCKCWGATVVWFGIWTCLHTGVYAIDSTWRLIPVAYLICKLAFCRQTSGSQYNTYTCAYIILYHYILMFRSHADQAMYSIWYQIVSKFLSTEIQPWCDRIWIETRFEAISKNRGCILADTILSSK